MANFFTDLYALPTAVRELQASVDKLIAAQSTGFHDIENQLTFQGDIIVEKIDELKQLADAGALADTHLSAAFAAETQLVQQALDDLQAIKNGATDVQLQPIIDTLTLHAKNMAILDSVISTYKPAPTPVVPPAPVTP